MFITKHDYDTSNCSNTKEEVYWFNQKAGIGRMLIEYSVKSIKHSDYCNLVLKIKEKTCIIMSVLYFNNERDRNCPMRQPTQEDSNETGE